MSNSGIRGSRFEAPRSEPDWSHVDNLSKAQELLKQCARFIGAAAIQDHRWLLGSALVFSPPIWAMGGEGLVGDILGGITLSLMLAIGGLWALFSLQWSGRGGLAAVAVVIGLVGLAWFSLFEVCTRTRRGPCFMPDGSLAYVLVFFQWLFTSAILLWFLLATGLFDAIESQIRGKRRVPKPYGIYNSEGRLLSEAEVPAAVALFGRQACDDLLRSFGSAQSLPDEPLDHLRARCVRVVSESMSVPKKWYCPSCRQLLPDGSKSLECPSCHADFGEAAAWRPVDGDTSA